ncbi:MAG: hypothetical protein JNL32_13610, partial [Candidatus Kapabacteria bacterium]|nr:hypothetical protein [Candidatus Kapabacteria bacterium]
MKVKEVWTDNDFEEMGWHDSYIHAISFPYDTLDLSLDIDYLFKWVFDDKDNMYDFWVSPCTLTFVNVLDIKIELNFQNSIGLYIVAILRDNPR